MEREHITPQGVSVFHDKYSQFLPVLVCAGRITV